MPDPPRNKHLLQGAVEKKLHPLTAARRILQMKKKLSTILLVLVFLAGLSLLLYPSVSNYWNSMHASQAVAEYNTKVKELSAEDYDQILENARAYNQSLLNRSDSFSLTEELEKEYEKQLDVGDDGIMGYVEIPNINVSLPIYHGTDDSVLQIAVGHLEWSSLPVGGESTHCVLSGHRGLPSAKLFTNLDKLTEGDIFVIRVLDEVLSYEVDRIRIVEPDELDSLQIEEGKDLCTLVTCTPYGINTHRLLVRGHRVANESEGIRVTSDAIQIEPVIVAPAVALPILLILLIVLLVSKPKKKSIGGKKNGKTE